HPWHLLNFPKRTEAAVIVHGHLTVLVMLSRMEFRCLLLQSVTAPTALATVLPTLSSALLGGEGIARWRKRLEEENRDKIIVFIEIGRASCRERKFDLVSQRPLTRNHSALDSPKYLL